MPSIVNQGFTTDLPDHGGPAEISPPPNAVPNFFLLTENELKKGSPSKFVVVPEISIHDNPAAKNNNVLFIYI